MIFSGRCESSAIPQKQRENDTQFAIVYPTFSTPKTGQIGCINFLDVVCLVHKHLETTLECGGPRYTAISGRSPVAGKCFLGDLIGLDLFVEVTAQGIGPSNVPSVRTGYIRSERAKVN